jgi:dethiobiotin synthetase
MHKFFITGTDTDVGKTLIASALLVAAKKQGLSTLAMKPLAAGCQQTADGLRNDDALMLQQHMTLTLPYEQINPIALEAAIAPHIAAERLGRRLTVSQLTGFCRGVLMKKVDLALIEGAGGWHLPLNRAETLAGLVKELKLPVILVVGLRLGCINHSLLTAEAIARDGLPLAGWVANQLDTDMDCIAENITAIADRLAAPCLGVVPFLKKPSAEEASAYLSLEKVITL